MASPIIFKITNAGKNAMLDAQNNGITLRLTHVALGTGKYTPNGNETALAGEVQRWVIMSGGIEPATHTVRFSSSITSAQELTAYEIGVFTDTGVLFAVASSTANPLVKVYPDITFIASFGLALDEFDTSKVTVSQDNEGALSIALMQQHLASPDPHPQYLNEARFQLLLRTLIPYGYLYHTHDTTNPKPWFDELMGIETWWRRLTGKTIVATDPNDTHINDVGIVLGQKGMTDLAISQRPNVYPLQTTHIFERYDPAKVIETVWTVIGSKKSVAEGEALSFTISANNIPDGQILPWVIKEGELNAQSNDITMPENTASGTVTIKNGTATVNYTTTAFDNMPEPQKHVRLTVGAPANLSINVPISDAGHTETVLHISQSTYNGIVLDEYYKQQSGSYPSSTDTVRFIVDSGVDVVAPDTLRGAIESGSNWPSGSQVIVENHGRILGRGGDGGHGGTILMDNNGTWSYLGTTQNGFINTMVLNPESGKNGGTAILGVKAITVENYGFIAGGGGGGAGSVTYLAKATNAINMEQLDAVFIQGSSGGGGSPFGIGKPNPSSYEYYKNYASNYAKKVDISGVTPPNGVLKTSIIAATDYAFANGAEALALRTSSTTSSGGTIQDLANNADYTIPPSVYSPLNLNANGKQYIRKTYLVSHPTEGDLYSVVLETNSAKLVDNNKHGSSGSLLQGGTGGYGINCAYPNGAEVNDMSRLLNHAVDVSENHAGKGGDAGSNGDSALQSWYFDDYAALTTTNTPQWSSPSAQGGQAGYVYQGSVTINNFGGGTTKGAQHDKQLP